MPRNALLLYFSPLTLFSYFSPCSRCSCSSFARPGRSHGNFCLPSPYSVDRCAASPIPDTSTL